MDDYIKADEIICQKDNHNEPIKKVVIDYNLALEDRILCSKCLINHIQMRNCISVSEAKNMIVGKLQSINCHMKQCSSAIIKDVKEFSEKIIKLRSQVTQQFDDILILAQEWINNILKVQQKSHSKNFIEDLKLLNEDAIQYDIFEQINTQSFTKINEKYQELLSSQIQNSFEQFQQFQSKNYFQQVQVTSPSMIENNQNSKNIQVDLINSVRHFEWSYALAFNYLSSIMVTGCRDDIIVWNFDKGKLMESVKLKGHMDTVLCLVFSKKLNWFVSGSCDQTIRCWKENDIGEWKSAKNVNQHRNVISCLIINNNEDQLISCSWDETIKIWKINTYSNEIEIDYSLEQKHTGMIFCISLNKSETTLISCSEDKKIILWNKEQNSSWQYKSFIATQDVGLRLTFISETEFVWQQKGKGITHHFIISNEEIKTNVEEMINLDETENDEAFFPTIYNTQRQIIIQKHNEFVYILKKSTNSKIIAISEPINCHHIQNFGALSNNGEYLAIWNQKTKEIKIYNIQYC